MTSKSPHQGEEKSEQGAVSRRSALLSGTSLVAAAALKSAAVVTPARAQQTSGARPNIVVIFADDVGVWNLSAYHRGMMGGRTPNIDRIAAEGALFTDYYSQN